MRTWQVKAKGEHTAQVMAFSETEIFLPVNIEEANWLYNSIRRTMQDLIKSGDFPEKEKYEALLHNISSVLFILSDGNNK